MDKALQELIQISNKVGKNPALVLGNYGNTSVKTQDGKSMYIKASGARLVDMDETAGWRKLDVPKVLDILDDKSLAAMEPAERKKKIDGGLLFACCDPKPASVLPSIESFFHALLGQCVIHLHPESVLAVACARDGQRQMEKLFAGEKYPPLWIPYAGLGYPSARKILSLTKQYETEHSRKPQIMVMQNHGLLVSANNAATALRLVNLAVKTCQSKLPVLKPAKVMQVDEQVFQLLSLHIRSAVFNTTGRYTAVHFYNNPTITAFLRHKNAKQLCAAGAVTPDEACMTAGAPVWLEKMDTKDIAKIIQRQRDKTGMCPVGFLVPGAGLFVAAPAKCADFIAEFFCSYMQVRTAAGKMGGPRAIPQKLIAEYCESKSDSPVKGPLANRHAVVTGSGSGLGRSIAIGLARAGAHVALADIDATAAQETAELIAREMPAISTLVLGCNVTNEQSVQAGFDRILAEWGGLDICVNAAGVAPAYSLMDLPVDKWRFALEVNLTGYFLMARETARIQVIQQMGGSIINISSKSGLDASKNNTPYNATKAGEIHMARGWALELGQHNIRVNCVCPGNVFEGSKIWNPEYIKVCAKKYGIKPEEVIPYYVSRTTLNKEIKGQDIADSVVFLASDQARRITGQTIVTDAGQVFVR